jgi:hypothetical protein
MPDDQSFSTLVVEVFSWLLLLWSFDLQLYYTMRKQETSCSFEHFYWCSYVVHLNFTYWIHEGWMAVGPHQGVVKLWIKILPSCNWCQQSIMLINWCQESREGRDFSPWFAVSMPLTCKFWMEIASWQLQSVQFFHIDLVFQTCSPGFGQAKFFSSSCDLVQTWYTAKYDLKVIRQTNFFLPLMGQTALDNSSGRTMKGTLGRKYRNITHETVLSLMWCTSWEDTSLHGWYGKVK